MPVYLEVRPEDIAHVKFLFEAHEEIGIVRTADRVRAVIVVLVMHDYAAVARAVLEELSELGLCREIQRPKDLEDDWLMREI